MLLFLGIGIACIAMLVELVCFIIVLIKMFKSGNALLGVIGIFCGIIPFIWGWINATEHQLKKVMVVFTAAIVLSIVGGAIAGAGGAFEARDQLDQLEQIEGLEALELDEAGGL